MLSALREEINALLTATQTCRRPALRRSDTPEALLATDLPFAAEDGAVAGFIARAEAAGWQVRRAENGWLLLDKEVPVPQAEIPLGAQGPCGRCISVLARHQEAGDARVWIRRIVTAQEAGERPLERSCSQLHRALAEMLRLRQPLPGALLPYLAQAYCNIRKDRRKRP